MYGEQDRDQVNVVVVGHVDHGKSTLIGRLLSDTKSLPQGKLEQVRSSCARNARPFEYAFLLDALKDEQAQGITIDTARCFLRTSKRRYLIFDTPGHIEFLRNMITGASKAGAAFIVIDAKEGIQDNTKRHAYMVSMLGIKEVSVLINKMDLVGYDEKVFKTIQEDYTVFMHGLNLYPRSFIPVSAFNGVNVGVLSPETPWYSGTTVLQQFDSFETEYTPDRLPFRFPLQDVYKFTEKGDDRRIFVGNVCSGFVNVDDEIIFLPSGKQSTIKSIEVFSAPRKNTAMAGEATGFTLKTQIYVKPGEIMVKLSGHLPHVSSRFRANLFWMGRAPMIKGKRYKLKLGATRLPIKLAEIRNILDASDLSSVRNKQQIDRYDIAECVIESFSPVAFDIANDNQFTGRFIVVDNYEIAGGGIILESLYDEESTLKEHVREREFAWKGSRIHSDNRSTVYGHAAKFVVITGIEGGLQETLATALEKELFSRNFKAYFLQMANVIKGLDADIAHEEEVRDEHMRRLGELARILTDSGQIFITSLSNVDDNDLNVLELLNAPNEILVISVGEKSFTDYKTALDLDQNASVSSSVNLICELLKQKKVIVEYQI